MTKKYIWSAAKNEYLKSTRNISFEEIIDTIARGNLLDIKLHPNQMKYAGQKIYEVKIKNYFYYVPFIETHDEIKLITIIPSRKLKHKYKEPS